MHIKHTFIIVTIIAGIILAFATGRTSAQSGGQNPTPIVITLTPPGQPPATPSPTADGSLPPDRFEPNDQAEAAAVIGWGIERDLTLLGKDVDYFTGYLKAGQIVQVSTTVYDGLDTRLKLYWDGHLATENDDRSPSDGGSTVIFTAPADGWYVALVERVTIYEGMYDLETALAQPTATPTTAPTSTPTPTLTPAPTLTPSPSPTPLMQPDLAEPNDTPETARPVTPGVRGTYSVGAGDVDYFTFLAKASSRYACETVTGQVDTLMTVSGGPAVIGTNDDRGVGRVDSYLEWTSAAEQLVIIKVEARGGSFGQYEFVCQNVIPPAGPPPGGSGPPTPAGSGPPLSLPATITPTGRISLTVQHLGRVQPQRAAQPTPIRLLVYYDANNDRQPGPGEGIAGVSVLAVDARGQRLARVFTNTQGEAVFNLTSPAIARVIVPFVPGWSARVRVGETNDNIVLGLPAVRLPVFLPIQNLPAAEE
jgi:hypothetical protein